MSSDRLAIRADQLSKRYVLGQRHRQRMLREALVDAARAPFRARRTGPPDTIWALRDVSFEIREGEVVGVIGRNGAGKSTLLKILSRITEPTVGRAELYGRVGSLLEVGTGFHSELTGRENIYLSGAILGMRRAEIARRFDEIVAFAEVERFIDTPVKHFSSGMYLRLAFAVAAHLEPEILLVDEVLAVGDAAFQKKCLGKMSDVSRQGRTVLFVSHNLAAVRTLTTRCLVLRDGEVASFDSTGHAIEKYLSDVTPPSPTFAIDIERYRRDKGASTGVKMVGVRVEGSAGLPAPLALGTSRFIVTVTIEITRRIDGAHASMILKDASGQHVTVLLSWDQGFSLTLPPGRHHLRVGVNDLPLAPGSYFADFGINQSTQTVAFDVLLDVPLLRVEVQDSGIHWPERPWGCIHTDDVTWSVE